MHNPTVSESAMMLGFAFMVLGMSAIFAWGLTVSYDTLSPLAFTMQIIFSASLFIIYCGLILEWGKEKYGRRLL
jgi:hypothetical protein